MFRRFNKILFNNNFLFIGLFIFLWFVYFLAANSFLDPDFGWHLKMGESIWLNKQIPKTDLFSYTLPNYYFPYSAWLGDVIIYLLFGKIGYSGLALFFSFIAVSGFIFSIKKDLIKFAIFPSILGGLSSIGLSAVRPQLVDFPLSALWFLILRKSRENYRYLFALPLLTIAWANLHGGFMLGIGVLLIMATADVYEFLRHGDRNVVKHSCLLLFAGLLCFLTGAINPFGFDAYLLGNHFFDLRLHASISEWLPFAEFNPIVIFYSGVLLAFLKLYGRKYSLFDKIVSIVLLISFLTARRFIVFFMIFTLPIFTEGLKEFWAVFGKTTVFKNIMRFRFMLIADVALLLIVYVFVQIKSNSNISERNFYPKRAVSILRSKSIDGNIFSTYGWGGYLIWQYPEKKTFIDGRMPIWRDGDINPFEQYLKLVVGDVDYKLVFNQFQIKTILWPKKELADNSFFYKYQVMLMKKLWNINHVDSLSFVQRLKSDGWVVTYEDEVAVILER